jgi:iron complex outermembrane receptor protein
MKEKKLVFFFLLCLPVACIMFFNTVEAQNVIASSKKRSKQVQSTSYTPPDQNEKQKLFNALRQLHQSIGIYFLLSDQSFGDIMVEPVIDFTQPVEKILNSLLTGTPLKFKKINHNTFIILSIKEEEPQATDPDIEMSRQAGVKQTITAVRFLKGKVIAADGSALSNVSVQIKGSLKGVVTNNKGEFDLMGNTGDVLVFSFVGYRKKEIIIDDKLPDFLTATLAVNEKANGRSSHYFAGCKKITQVYWICRQHHRWR